MTKTVNHQMIIKANGELHQHFIEQKQVVLIKSSTKWEKIVGLSH